MAAALSYYCVVSFKACPIEPRYQARLRRSRSEASRVHLSNLLEMTSADTAFPIESALLIGLSYLLGLYFRHFAHFNKTYGTLGAAIASTAKTVNTVAKLPGCDSSGRLLDEVSQGAEKDKPEAGVMENNLGKSLTSLAKSAGYKSLVVYRPSARCRHFGFLIA